ncbi:hypothetical protein GCM10009525_16410 [Streptosporangium amethystogenes subsp. fukuiense]
MIVTMTRDGVRISTPGQPGVLLGFDAWETFLHQVRKGWFAPEADDRRRPDGRITCWARVHSAAFPRKKAGTPANDRTEANGTVS